MKYKYRYGVLGGTFDRLHVGHEDLLETALNQSQNLVIGLGTEKIYGHKLLSQLIEPYSVRENELNKYFKKAKRLADTKIIALNDIYGVTIEDKNLEAIFVTEATIQNARIINKKREEKGMKLLDIIEVPLRKDENNQIISSERIRLGQIDRNGLAFMNLFKEKDVLKLPSGLRKGMRNPIGKIVKKIENIKKERNEKSLLVSVGDIVTKNLREINCTPDIEIIDFKTRRYAIDKESLKEFKLNKGKFYVNPQGEIRREVVCVYAEAIEKVLKKTASNIKIVIEGEEDLLSLPAILLAPLGSIVCYGVHDLNAIIQVDVTEENKEIIFKMLQQFE